MGLKRQKIYLGTGAEAANIAARLGASKATISRIRTGRQDFYFAGYHDLNRDGEFLPSTKAPINELIEIGVRAVWPEISDFDLDDVRQEVLLRIMGLKKRPQSADAIVVWWAKRVAMSLRRMLYSARISFSTALLLYRGENMQYEEIWDEYQVENRTSEELQEILNSVDTKHPLYIAFRTMRYRQSGGKCAKCGLHEWGNWELHHIVPRRIRTINTVENTVGLCRLCHAQIEIVNGVAEQQYGRDVNYNKLFQAFLRQGVDKTLDQIKEDSDGQFNQN